MDMIIYRVGSMPSIKGPEEYFTGNVSIGRWIQPIDATHALNIIAGVSYSNVFLGRSFSCRAIAFSLA